MSSASRATLIKIAKLYYYGKLSQEQIGHILGISRPKVSRLLTMAQDMGIVEFHIADSALLNEQMEQKLKEHLGLGRVVIAPSGPGMSQSQENAGRAAAAYLNEKLENGMLIGVSWGTTMDMVVSQFTATKQYQDILVVQLLGGIRTQSFNIDSRELALTLAKKLGARYSLLQAPLLVSSGQIRDILMKEPEFASHCALFDRLDMAIVGIGSGVPERSVPYRAGYITLEQSQQLVADGFATDICGHRIYLDGSTKANVLDDRIVSINLDQVKRIPDVIGVAVGEDKAKSIIAACRGGYLNTLITDEIAAMSILGLEGIQ